jgi:hypothetical protein
MSLREFLQHTLGASGAAAFDEDKISRVRIFAEQIGRFFRTGNHFACGQASGLGPGRDLS